MKRLSFCLFYLVLSVISAVCAEKVEVNGVFYNLNKEEKTAEVTFYGDDWLFLQNNYTGSLSIPKSIEHESITYKVTAIGEGAFYYCKDLKSVSLPESIKTIGDYAFANCILLNSVIIPESVTTIGAAAFRGCKSILSITIPNSVLEIGSSAFQYCDTLHTITLSDNITEVASLMFEGCKNLTSITIPQKVTDIRKAAFQNCISLSNIEFNECLETIGENAFYGNSTLKDIELPNSLKSVGHYSFENCTNLTDVRFPINIQNIGINAFKNTSLENVELPEGITVIHSNTFSNCSKLQVVSFPSTLTTIGESAFYGCKKLMSVEFPEGLNNINSSAFSGCENISSLVLPNNVSLVQTNAFLGCNLNTIYVKNINLKCSNVFSDKIYRHAILFIPKGMRDNAIFDSDWYLFYNIKETVMSSSDLSNAKAYLLMDNMSFKYLIYDDFVNQTIKTDSYFDLDENNLDHNWQVLTDDDKTYLYNLGAQKYAECLQDGQFLLTPERRPVNMEETIGGFCIGQDNHTTWSFVESTNATTNVLTNRSETLPPQAFYLLNGLSVSNPPIGISVLRYRNGENRKVIIK